MPRMKGTANKTKQLTLSEVIEIHNARIAANMPCNGCMCKEYCQEKAKYTDTNYILPCFICLSFHPVSQPQNF